MHLAIVGGSDAGISAALRARELDPTVDVTVVVADAYPNYSICGIPYFISGEVGHWTNLAHRTLADLEATGMRLLLDTHATRSTSTTSSYRRDQPGRSGSATTRWSSGPALSRPTTYRRTGPARARRRRACAALDGRHVRPRHQPEAAPRSALIVGAGYVGLEMAEGLTARGVAVTQVEMLPEVLPTVDPELGALVHAELDRHGVDVAHPHHRHPGQRSGNGTARLHVDGTGADGQPTGWDVDLVLVVVGVRPDTDLLVRAGAKTGARGAVVVDETMATGLPHVWAAGDCVVTHHRLSSASPTCRSAPPPTSRAGSPARTPSAARPGSPASSEPRSSRSSTSSPPAPASATTRPEPPATPRDRPVHARRPQGLLPGRPPHHHPGHRRPRPPADCSAPSSSGGASTETAKRVDTYATALFHNMTVDDITDLDLSYTPPLGSPWDAVQVASPGMGPRTPAGIPWPRPTTGTVRRCCSYASTTPAGRSSPPAWPPHTRVTSDVLSAGTVPDAAVSPVMVASLAELGIDRSDQVPTQLTDELLHRADVVVALKAGLAFAAPDGVDQQTWDLPNPADWDVDSVRPLRDHIQGKVHAAHRPAH